MALSMKFISSILFFFAFVSCAIAQGPYTPTERLPVPFTIDNGITVFMPFAAQNYYFAASGIDGGACGLFTPCQTIAYLNTLSLVAGDTIFFNRGDSFTGELKPNASGSSSQPIWYGAYGTGNIPVITGAYRLVGYTNVSGNIWSAPCPSCRPTTNLVTYNGSLQGMGRTPNTGYNTVSVASGTSYITDPTLTGTPNYSGGQLVLRVNHFTLTRNTITSQSVDTLRYTAINGGGLAGWGYFLQNHPSTLDQNGEWYYNPGTNQMQVYLTDTTKPVIVGVVDTLAYSPTENYIIFDHLNFQYGNTAAIELTDNTGVRVQNCNIQFCNQGIAATLETNCKFNNNTISFVNDYGVNVSGNSTGNQIDNNLLHDVGTIPGMGLVQSGYFGMSIRSGTTEAVGNNIYNIGYVPILISGTLDTVNYNVIDSFCYVVDDGGGVYWSETHGQTFTGRRCIGNMVYNGIGAPNGTNITQGQGVGIYFDDNNTQASADSNSCFNNSFTGLYIHNSQNIEASYNNLYNNTFCQATIVHDNLSFLPVRGASVEHNNIGGSPGPLFYLLDLSAFYDSIGTIDSNKYVTPTPQWYIGTTVNTATLQTYSQWQTATQTDSHSLFFPGFYVFYYNPSLVAPLSLTIPSYADFWIDLAGAKHFTYSLPAIQSAILSPQQTITPIGTISKKLIPG